MTVKADNPLQEQGYYRVYRAIVEQSGVDEALLYGILEDLAQVSARNKRTLSPSHKFLADAMGCGARSIKSYLDTLQDGGWITWEPGKTSNTYTLCSQSAKFAESKKSQSANFSTTVCKNCRQANTIELTDSLLPNGSKYPPTPQRDFQTFWEPYPRKDSGRKTALQSWERAIKRGADPDAIMAGLARWLPVWEVTERQYIPHAATWLNQERWDAEPPPLPIRMNGHGRMAETEDLRRTMRYLEQQAAGGVVPPDSPLPSAPHLEGQHR